MGKRTEAQDRSGVGQLVNDYLEARKQTAKDDQTGKPCLPAPGTKPDRSQHDKEEGETSHHERSNPSVETPCQQSPATTVGSCPEKAMYCASGRWPKSTLQRAGLVEGRKLNYIVQDTGCSKTQVHHDLVLQEKLLPGRSSHYTLRTWGQCTLLGYTCQLGGGWSSTSGGSCGVKITTSVCAPWN